jgi:hypothetical protein
MDAVTTNMRAQWTGAPSSVYTARSDEWVKNIPAPGDLKKEAARDFPARIGTVRMGPEYAPAAAVRQH